MQALKTKELKTQNGGGKPHSVCLGVSPVWGHKTSPLLVASSAPFLSTSVALAGSVGSSTGGRKHVVTGVPWEVTLEHFPFSDPVAFIYMTPCPPPSRSIRSGVELAPREVWAPTGSEQLGGILNQCFLSWSQQICAQGSEFSQNSKKIFFVLSFLMIV